MTHLADPAAPTRLPLTAGVALLHEEGACLPLRSRHGQCTACAQACPVGALSVTIDALVLSDACTGCGRCTVACPTQALSLPELALLDRPAVAAVLRIECRMVDPSRHGAPTCVVPCLGAINVGHLLQHAAAGVDVQLIDRGWCAGCPAVTRHAAGGDAVVQPATHPAQATLDSANAWLDAIGAGPRPSLQLEPLPVAQRPRALPALAAAPNVDRRSFFRVALQRPAGRARGAVTAMGGDGRAAYPPERRCASPERERQLNALARLAEAARTAVPAEFYPRLQAGPDCCDRRLCVGICPTGALAATDDGATAALRFSAERCIACGACTRACPDSALMLAPHGGAAGVHTLATHMRRRCAECGDAFTPPRADDGRPGAGTPLCPACTKSHRFVDDARRQLFGAPN